MQRVVNHDVQFVICGLRTAICDLRFAMCALRFETAQRRLLFHSCVSDYLNVQRGSAEGVGTNVGGRRFVKRSSALGQMVDGAVGHRTLKNSNSLSPFSNRPGLCLGHHNHYHHHCQHPHIIVTITTLIIITTTILIIIISLTPHHHSRHIISRLLQPNPLP